MYDLQNDPTEVNNLAWKGASRTPEQVRRRGVLGAARVTPAPCFTMKLEPTPLPPLTTLPAEQEKEYKRLKKLVQKVFRTRLQPLKTQTASLNMTAVAVWASPKQGTVRAARGRQAARRQRAEPRAAEPAASNPHQPPAAPPPRSPSLCRATSRASPSAAGRWSPA
jgi:hypothetical protein